MHFEELPAPMPGMRIWGAKIGGYQFVIAHEDGTALLAGDRREWRGYTASFRNTSVPKSSTRIEGMWQTMTEAEEACRITWRQLRQQR